MSLQTINIGPFRYTNAPENKLGKGSYGEVWLGEHSQTREKVAIKTITLSTASRVFTQESINLDRERDILRKLDHPNIVKLLYDYEDPTVKGGRKVYFVMEYMKGGDLDSYIRKRYSRGMPENLARRFLCQMAAGLEHMNNKGFVHRDLKPQNLMLSSSDDDAILKITDFGFAREEAISMHSVLGSPLYMAPEIHSGFYSSNADMWSCGLIFVQMITGSAPFPTARKPNDILVQINNGPLPIPDILSPEAKELVSGLLQADKTKRLTWSKFCSHPYLQNTSMAESVVAGDANWLQEIHSFELGIPLKYSVSAALKIYDLKRALKNVCTPMNSNEPVSEKDLICATGEVELNDNMTLADYGLDKTYRKIFVYLKGTLECVNGEPRIFSVASNPECPSLSLKSLISSSDLTKTSYKNWKSNAELWETVLESYREWGNKLQNRTITLGQNSKFLAGASLRRTPWIVISTHYRNKCLKIVSEFATVSKILKEESPRLLKLRNHFESTFEEMKRTSLANIAIGYPELMLDPKATMITVLNGNAAWKDWIDLQAIHKQLLETELSIGRSSDPEAARFFQLPGSDYKESGLIDGVISPNTNSNSGYFPAFEKTMKDLNAALGSVETIISTSLSKCGEAFDRSWSKAMTTFNIFNSQIETSSNLLKGILTYPAEFSISWDELEKVMKHLTMLSDLSDTLKAACAEMDNDVDLLLNARFKLDSAYYNALYASRKAYDQFVSFNHSTHSVYIPNAIRITQMIPLLDIVMGTPEAFRSAVAETERRRVWVSKWRKTIKQVHEQLLTALSEEEKTRLAWSQLNRDQLPRLKAYFPGTASQNERDLINPGTLNLTWIPARKSEDQYPALAQFSSSNTASAPSSSHDSPNNVNPLFRTNVDLKDPHALQNLLAEMEKANRELTLEVEQLRREKAAWLAPRK